MKYQDFIATKTRPVVPEGFEPKDTMDALYPFQRDLVDWAVRRGSSAIFADCGLGKTPMQLEWARQMSEHTHKPVLIFAPLAVTKQTQREGAKFGIPVEVVRSQHDVVYGVNITNYQMLEHFEPGKFGGLVIDESSCLKAYGSVYRKLLTGFGEDIKYRLACTATPAPNDLIEIINHAEFLRVNKGKEIIALYFIQDGNTTNKWRIKKHAKDAFWRWMASWARAVRSPSDMGYANGVFELPPLNHIQHTVEGNIVDGMLFPVEAHTMQERRQARRASIDKRVAVCADIVNDSTEPWLVWCDLNLESEALRKSIPDAIEVKGSDADDHKVDAMIGFQEGRYRVLVSKPSICGFGMNFQNCHNMAFVGLSDSFEKMYQAVRRCWRFGQTNQVNVYVIVSETEGAVVENLQRKEHDAAHMMEQITKHMHDSTHVSILSEAERDYSEALEVPMFLDGRSA